MSKRVAASSLRSVSAPLAERKFVLDAGQELVRQYDEWRHSFQNPNQRKALIRSICDRIATEFNPEKIILFGSHAYGKPTLDSDLDLMVIMPFEGSPLSQAVKICRHLNLMIPIDLIVRTRSQVNERLAIEDSFMHEIMEQGKVMYEAHYR
jgi:uncharacterized protein